MSANVIDSLVVSLGLDPAELVKGIQKVETFLNDAQGVVSEFAEGVDQGFMEGAAGAEELASAAKEAGKALEEAGDNGGKGLDKVADKAQKASKEVRSLQNEAKKLGKSLGRNIKGFLTGLAAPMAGMLAAGVIVKGYFSDLGKLDELSRKTSLSMKERASKQKLLAKYSKEDLERYRESNKALESLGDTLSRAFAPVMSAIVPALTWFARGLEKMIKFVERHGSFVIPLIAGIATVIMIALIPAIKRLEFVAVKAAWAAMKPLLPWIVLVAALALVFNSLWVFMNGGDSIIERLMRKFGASEETIEKVRGKVKELYESVKQFAPQIGMVIGILLAGKVLMGPLAAGIGLVVKAFGVASTVIRGVATAIRIMSMAAMANPVVLVIMAIIAAIALCIIYWDEIKEAGAKAWDFIKEKWDQAKELFDSIGQDIVAAFTEAFELVYDVVMSIFADIGEFFTDIFNSIMGTVVGAVKGIISKIPDFLLPDSLLEWANNVDETVKQTAANMQNITAGDGAITAADGISPALAAGPVDNSTKTTMNGGIQVYSQATDANGIAKDIGGAVERRMTATGNKGVRQ